MRAAKLKSGAKGRFDGRFDADGLKQRWPKLHRGDAEPFPNTALVTRLGKQQPRFAAWVAEHGGSSEVATRVQEAWRCFHAGDYAAAIAAGGKLGALGATAANKAASIYSLESAAADPVRLLEEAIARGEKAVALLPEYANAHYMLALALGRHSQRISIVQALANGVASRVRQHLEATLRLEPGHAEAHVAFGLYHAEIVAKIGSLLAGLTYQASGKASLEHFRTALKLAPSSPIAMIEYANGLLLIDAAAHRAEAKALYARAAATVPADAMEQGDVERARRLMKG